MEDGNQELADQISWKIQQLEDQSAEIYRKQDEGIRAISWINQKNKEKMKQSFLTGAAVAANEDDDKDNPFNRKNSRTKMVVGSQKGGKAPAGPNILPGLDSAKSGPAEPSTSTAPTYVPAPAASGPKSVPKLPPAPRVKLPSPPSITGKKDHSLYEAHAFDIDIDIGLPAAPVPPTHPQPLPPGKPLGPAKKTLNLDEYKQKRNLI